jgi:dihydrolipoamide dehydrogenase
MPLFVPIGLHTTPELASVGPPEHELRSAGTEYIRGVAGFAELSRSRIDGGSEGFLKLLVDPATHRLLAVHAAGPGAIELLHAGQLLLALGGGVDTFVGEVGVHPSYAEAYAVAAARAVAAIESG